MKEVTKGCPGDLVVRRGFLEEAALVWSLPSGSGHRQAWGRGAGQAVNQDGVNGDILGTQCLTKGRHLVTAHKVSVGSWGKEKVGDLLEHSSRTHR